MEHTSPGLNIIEMVANSSPIAKLVLLILLAFSVTSWTIIVNKFISFHLARREDGRFMSAFGKNPGWSDVDALSKELRFSPVARVFATGYNEFLYFQNLLPKEESRRGAQPGANTLPLEDLKSIAIAMDDAINKEAERLGSSLTFLATTGSSTPFIGLFGTVWGIMYSFHSIGVKGSASIANVAPGIAEALIATAAGLFVAIPAVIFYNFLNGKIQWFTNRMENFLHNFICRVEKEYIHKRSAATGERTPPAHAQG